jgi:hypothetical protein
MNKNQDLMKQIHEIKFKEYATEEYKSLYLCTSLT